MRLFVLFVLGAFAQEANVENDNVTEATETAAPETAAPETTAPETTAGTETAGPMANDYVQDNYDGYDYGYYETPEEPQARDMSAYGRSGGSVNSINNLQLSLLPNGDFEFTFDFDGTITHYNFEYQELIGGYQNVTDYIQFNAGNIAMTTDGVTTTSTLTPPEDDKVFRWQLTAFVNTDASAPVTIDGQAYTSTVIHQPGDVYNGGGGYAAQILMPTDFSSVNFVPTSDFDTVGYVIAVLVQFPAGCPSIHVSADVDASYIYTDPANADNHRIFVFPETHFSNQFSGAIKAFHYYVSGAEYAGCDLSDPANQVTVSVANSYLVRTSESADVDMFGSWPSDSAYPPMQYTEQHVVNLTDFIQPATHIGPSRALSAPRVYFSTTGCDVTLNVEAGTSPGWGMLNVFQSTLDMTDLWSDTPTSNTGDEFSLQALIWLTQVGVTFRYDTTAVGCETITSSATVTFIELDPSANLDTAVNPT